MHLIGHFLFASLGFIDTYIYQERPLELNDKESILWMTERIWVHGRKAFPKDNDTQTDIYSKAPFRNLQDYRIALFLEGESRKPVRPFSNAIRESAFENALENALIEEDPWIRFQALIVLVKGRAAYSVDKQWNTLQILMEDYRLDNAKQYLENIQYLFSTEHISLYIHKEPPKDPFCQDHDFIWAIRAAGVRKLPSMLHRLKRLSCAKNIYTSLAAERSLEDYEGAEGDLALIECMLAWNGVASINAGKALASRNRELSVKVMSNINIPDEYKPEIGLLLARCDSPNALPILVNSVGNVAIGDQRIFEEIERLAGAEHWRFVEQLPQKVREDQRERAKKVVENVRSKIGR